VKDLSLEGQIVRISDMIAYTTSDINDAIRADILKLNSIPEYIINFIGSKHSERVNTLVTNVIENSVDCSHQETDDPWIRMSDDLIEIITELRNFMFEKVYLPVSDSKPAKSAMKIVDIIFEYLVKNPEKIPNHLIEICDNNIEKASIDYITGMTDEFALRFSEKFDTTLAQDVFEGRL
jgi:dGTPase